MSIYTQIVKPVLMFAALGGTLAAAVKLLSILLALLVPVVGVATGLVALAWIGRELLSALAKTLRAKPAEDRGVVAPEAAAAEPQPEPAKEEPELPEVVALAQEETGTEQALSEAIVTEPQGSDLCSAEEPDAEAPEQAEPVEPEAPEDLPTHRTAEEEAIPESAGGECGSPPETVVAPEPEVELVAASCSPAEQAPEHVTKDDLEAALSSGALTFRRMKAICREKQLTGYGKLKNCAEYVDFLAQAQLRRSDLDLVA